MNEAAGFRSNLRQMIAQMIAGGGHLRCGLVNAYDPVAYRVKVVLQPEGIETGWMPILTLMSGSSFGVYAAPSQGNEALVFGLEGDAQVLVCLGFLNNVEDVPPTIQSGEVKVIAKAGGSMAMTQDGHVTVADESGSTLVLSNDNKITLTASGGFFVDADLTCTGTVWGKTDVTGGSGAISLKGHKHTGVQTGSGETGGPTNT